MTNHELAIALRRTAGIVISEDYGSSATRDALAVLRYADQIDDERKGSK